MLYGALGFGLGGLVYGVAISIPSPATGYFLALSGFVVQAAPGGIALGLAMKKNWRETIMLGVFSTIGFLIGKYILILPFALLIGDRFSGNPPESYFVGLLVGGLTGAGAGAAIALGSYGKVAVKSLAIAGGLGFGIGMLVTTPLYYGLTPQHWLGHMLTGLIGGTTLGAAIGKLKGS